MKDHATKPNPCKQLDANLLTERQLHNFVIILPFISLTPYACSLFCVKCHIHIITSYSPYYQMPANILPIAFSFSFSPFPVLYLEKGGKKEKKKRQLTQVEGKLSEIL